MAASQATHGPMPWWGWAFPALGLGVMLVGKATPGLVVAAALLGCVFAAVHLAETVAMRVGEPYGSLILACAVTVLEAGMIVSMMLGGSGPTVARDAIFAALMIALNGIVGLALVVNAARHGAGRFSATAANASLAVLIPLAVLTMVLPNFTLSTPGRCSRGRSSPSSRWSRSSSTACSSLSSSSATARISWPRTTSTNRANGPPPPRPGSPSCCSSSPSPW